MSQNHRRPQQFGKRPYESGRSKKVRKQDIIAVMMRHAKRDLINRGVIQDPANRPPRFKYTWIYGNLRGVVYADDRSTARAFIKRELGIRKKSRLPIEVQIERESNIEDSTEGPGEDARCTDQRRKTCTIV